MIQGLILDLDDTLYLERDYVHSGFSALAAQVSDRGGSEAEILDFLWSGFEKGVRGNAFDLLREHFPEVGSRYGVEEMVEIYRGHHPSIELLEPDTVDEIRAVPVAVGLISDGWPGSQELKIAALGLFDMFDVIVLTGVWGSQFWKPDHRGFAHVEAELGLPGDELVYVADNPRKDFVAPNARGWMTVRLRRQGQLHHDVEPPSVEHAPALEIGELEGILAYV